MDKKEAVKLALEFSSRLFPRKCGCCGKHYDSLKEYLSSTTKIDRPISYDAEDGDFRPTDPLGTFSMHNCSCGSTLVISTMGMDLDLLWRYMDWVKAEAKKQNVSMRVILENLRIEVHKAVFHENPENEDR